MKIKHLVVALVFLLSIAPIPLKAADDVVEKTVCTQAIGYQSMDALKKDLLANAQRQAVNELFGELIEATTSVDNFVVTSDQIRTSSLGLVRIEGTIEYYNGTNLAEVCITIRAYATEQDREQFNPVRLTKRHCVTNADLTTRQLIDFAKEEVIVQALLDYDRKLDGRSRRDLLGLLEKVNYLEGGFVPDTETYCTRVEGHVVPIEITAFVESSTAARSSKDFGRNLVVNGDFETPNAGGRYTTFQTGQAVQGWTVDRGSIDLIGQYWQAGSGKQSIDLSGDEAASIFQDVTTVPGETYRLRFKYSGNPDGSPKERQLEVRWNDTLVDTLTIDTRARSRSNMQWVEAEYPVRAQSDVSRVKFVSLNTGTFGPALDSVSVSLAE